MHEIGVCIERNFQFSNDIVMFVLKKPYNLNVKKKKNDIIRKFI